MLLQIFHKYIDRILAALFMLLALPAAYLLLLSLGIPVPYIMLSRLHQLILLSGELFLAVFFYKRNFLLHPQPKKLACFGRDLLLINAAFLFPFIKFYADPLRSEIPVIAQIQPFLIPGYAALLLATVVMLILLGNLQQARAWLNHKIDARRLSDQQQETDRAKQFQVKFPAISRIAPVGALLEKLYQQGTGYLAALSILGLLGLGLRVWQLDALPPYIDEFFHLNAARHLAQGLPLDQVLYRRSLYTVTLPVALSFKLFGVNLWAGRLPGALVNILAMIPLYLLGKRINKPVALIATALYAFSPWMIAAARNVREYAYFPLIFYSLGLVTLALYESVPERVVLQRDLRALFRRDILLYASLLVFALYFIQVVDPLSTLKVLLIYYPILGLLLLRKIDWRQTVNVALTALLLAAGMIALALIGDSLGGHFLLANFENRDYAFFPALFFEMPAQQWYYNRPLIAYAVSAFALLAVSWRDQRKTVLPFALLTFLGGLAAFSFLFLKGERPRYTIHIEIWFILLAAVGLYCAFLIVERAAPRYRWIAWLALALYFWNIPHTLHASRYAQPGWHPITDEYHADIAPALDFLQDRLAPDDAIVTTTYITGYENFYAPGLLNAERIVLYDREEPEAASLVYAAMDAYRNGWIVFDYPRGLLWSQPVPLRDFIYQDKQVEYLGWFGNVYILRWDSE